MYKHNKDFRYFADMDIRNNLLKDIKLNYKTKLLNYYDVIEADKLITILIEHYFNIPRYELIINPSIRISESEILKLHNAVEELKRKKPIQYIIGSTEFLDTVFTVSPAVLIPRPETEELVLKVSDREKGKVKSIIDIGTGSGCIAISLKKLMPETEVFAIDISEEALKIASKNACDNGCEITFFEHDILSNSKLKSGFYNNNLKFDIIVSNPPYVTEEDKVAMDDNVLNHEPAEALFVPNDDPLRYYRAILLFAESNLIIGGRVYFEINEMYGDFMRKILQEFKYSHICIEQDLFSKDRFACGVKTI